jgi:hypothetical protein
MQSATLADLNKFFNNVDTTNNFDYGKEFGGLFFMYMDLEVKKQLMDLIYINIIDCSLEGWEDKETFYKAVSFQDYETLIWGQACLMFRNGVDTAFVCAKDSCDYVERFKIDINKLRINNYKLIPEKCIDFMNDPKKKTLEQILQYQKDLMIDKPLRLGMHKFDLAIPTWERYLDEAGKFNSAMTKEVFVTSRPDVEKYIRYNFFKLYTPWISKYTNYVNDTSEDIDYVVEDMSALPKMLDVFQSGGDEITGVENFASDFSTNITEFIRDTKISIFGYRIKECPKCHQIPETSYKDIIPYDVQSDFFYLTKRKLEIV